MNICSYLSLILIILRRWVAAVRDAPVSQGLRRIVCHSLPAFSFIQGCAISSFLQNLHRRVFNHTLLLQLALCLHGNDAGDIFHFFQTTRALTQSQCKRVTSQFNALQPRPQCLNFCSCAPGLLEQHRGVLPGLALPLIR